MLNKGAAQFVVQGVCFDGYWGLDPRQGRRMRLILLQPCSTGMLQARSRAVTRRGGALRTLPADARARAQWRRRSSRPHSPRGMAHNFCRRQAGRRPHWLSELRADPAPVLLPGTRAPAYPVGPSARRRPSVPPLAVARSGTAGSSANRCPPPRPLRPVQVLGQADSGRVGSVLAAP